MNTPAQNTQIQTSEDISFYYSTLQVQRAAERVRAEAVGKAFAVLGQRIRRAHRATTELFGFAQQMNQAARL